MRSPNSAPSVPQAATESMPELLSPGLAHSLTEVGFLAMDQRDWSRAQQIFSVLMAFRRQSEFPYVGLSMVELLQGHWGAAKEWAISGLVQVPGSRALAELRDMTAGGGVPS